MPKVLITDRRNPKDTGFGISPRYLGCVIPHELYGSEVNVLRDALGNRSARYKSDYIKDFAQQLGVKAEEIRHNAILDIEDTS